MKTLSVLAVLLFATLVFSVPNSWLSTRYRPDVYSTGSWYRSPVTNGHLDLRVFVDNATFTEAVFTIKYDSALVDILSAASILELRAPLSLVSVVNDDLEGSWKQATITLAGEITIGQVEYESESIFKLRFTPVAEGTFALTLWQKETYPERYYNCNLTLTNNGTEVVHERKEYNDGTQLFTFTDKTSATVRYHHDYNFGDPLAGYLRVTYTDSSVEEFHQSNHEKGITIDAENGGYFITAQPDATEHLLVFPGYGNWTLSLNGGWSSSRSQPEGHFFVPELFEGGSGGLKAGSEDIFLTIESPGIGTNFATSTYLAKIAGDTVGVVDKDFTYEYIDDDKIGLTILGGLEADFNYNLYVYKDAVVLGRTWFTVSQFYPVTFTVQDENSTPLAGAMVRLPIWGMMGVSYIDELTDENGQAVFELAGNPEWGNYVDYYVILAGYDGVSDFIEVYDSALSVPVTIYASQAAGLPEFAGFSSFWDREDCSWNNNCDGADMNFDGAVNTDDLILFAFNWLRAD